MTMEFRKANEAKGFENMSWIAVSKRVDEYLNGYLPPGVSLTNTDGMHISRSVNCHHALIDICIYIFRVHSLCRWNSLDSLLR